MINTVCLCGSTRFLDEFHEANVELTKRGLSVVTISMCLPRNDQDAQEDANLKELLDLVHLNKILRSDAVFVVGDGYVGRSTEREILWAEMQGRPVVARHPAYNWNQEFTYVRCGILDNWIYVRDREVLGIPR